jgi:hypothetical protein
MQQSRTIRFLTLALLAAVGFGLGWVVVADDTTEGAIEWAPPVAETPAGAESPPAGATPPSSGATVSGTPKVTMTGTIEVAGKSLLGQAEQVKIVSPEHGSFLIEPGGKGEELKQLVGEQVTVVAERKTDAEGQVTLAVEHYMVEKG